MAAHACFHLLHESGTTQICGCAFCRLYQCLLCRCCDSGQPNACGALDSAWHHESRLLHDPDHQALLKAPDLHSYRWQHCCCAELALPWDDLSLAQELAGPASLSELALPLALDRESLCWAQAWSLAVLVCACQAWVERALLQEAALLAR